MPRISVTRIRCKELTVTINLAQDHRCKRFRRSLAEFGEFSERYEQCGLLDTVRC